MTISGNSAIPAGATVASIVDDTHITISAAATATASNVSTTFGSTTASVAGINISAGTLGVSGAGVLNDSGTLAIEPGAILSLDNSGTNVNNRLSNGPVTSYGGAINITGNSTAPTFEQTGAFAFGSGASVITLTPNASQSLTLTLGTSTLVTRSTGGTALFRIPGLGTVVSGSVSVVTSSTSSVEAMTSLP